MPADDIEVIHMTAVEYDRALQASLDNLGLTWEELTAQAAARDFSSLEAQQLWLTAGGQGPTQAEPVMAEGSYDWWRIRVERLEADVQAAYAERDQQFERKCEALRECDEARRERDEAREQRDRAVRAWVRNIPAELAEIKDRADQAEATVARAYAFAEEMRSYCSPYGISADYADRLIERLDAPQRPETTTTPARETA